MNARFDRRIGRLIAGAPRDTPAAIAERRRHAAACASGRADREARFPVLTAENAAAAIAYQEERISWHLRALEAGR